MHDTHVKYYIYTVAATIKKTRRQVTTTLNGNDSKYNVSSIKFAMLKDKIYRSWMLISIMHQLITPILTTVAA